MQTSKLKIIINTLSKRKFNFSTNSILNSHIGIKPIFYPTSVEFNYTNSLLANVDPHLRISGPKGQLSIKIHPFIKIENLPTITRISTNSPSLTNSIQQSAINLPLNISILNPSSKHQKAIWGLTRSLIANAVVGVSTGYELSIKLVGVGYRASVENVNSLDVNQQLNLKLGYAHPILINLPQDVLVTLPSTTTIILSGTDKQRLGEVAARIRNWRVPEPYNGKGIFVGNETIRRKEVKKK